MPSSEIALAVLEVPSAIRRRLAAAAEAGRPEEVCGALIGVPTGAGTRVTDAVELPNRAADPRREYRLDPDELAPLFRAADVIGFYHSHPDGPARFSALDAAEARAGYWYLVVGRARAETGGVAETTDGAELTAWRDGTAVRVATPFPVAAEDRTEVPSCPR